MLIEILGNVYAKTYNKVQDLSWKKKKNANKKEKKMLINTNHLLTYVNLLPRILMISD